MTTEQLSNAGNARNWSSHPRPEMYAGRKGDLRSVEEIAPVFRHVFHEFTQFNEIQSLVMDDMLYTDKSLVVSAPTGSGKTAIFELAMVRLLMKLEDAKYGGDFRMIYIAPIKALCAEKCNSWKGKFERLGVKIAEVTGDTEMRDFWDWPDCNLILTTPEKWNSITRRWRQNVNFVRMIKLVMIDEVHILNDQFRGPVLEAVVSRMRNIHRFVKDGGEGETSAEPMRIIALSATAPNVADLAAWVGEGSTTCFYNYKCYFGMEALERLPKKSGTATADSLTEMALEAYVAGLAADPNGRSAEQVEHLPTRFLIDILELISEYLNLVKLQRQLLTNPRIISRVLENRKDNQTKLVKCFQWAEIYDKSLVNDMVANYCFLFRKESVRDDLHPLGYAASLRLGTFLSETGWHQEAVKVLNVARQQAKLRPLEQLKAMRLQLISQNYMGHLSAYDTSMTIQKLIAGISDLPKAFLASLYLAISVCRSQYYNHALSHEYALKALELLDDETSSNRLIVEVFSQMAKTCVSQNQNQNAKLLITQAVSRAWHNFGPRSVMYRKTLEDYSFYLLMMNALNDSYKVFCEAFCIQQNVYDPQNMTKSNQIFDFYCDCLYIFSYSGLKNTKLHILEQIELMTSNQRLVAVAKCVYALLESTAGHERYDRQRDHYQPIQKQLSIADVRRLLDES